MNRKFGIGLSLQVGSLLALLIAIPALAQDVVNCQPGAGEPAKAIELFGEVAGTPFEIVAAVGSKAISFPFAVHDSSGRGIPNVAVEVVLPESPAELQFLPFDSNVTPKRALLEVPASCVGYVPQLVVGSEAGTVNATMRVVGHAPAINIPIRALDISDWVRYDRGDPSPMVVALGQSVQTGATAEWSDGKHFGPLAGLLITITAPASGPSMRFANGSNEIVVPTDASGGAAAAAVATSLGVVDVRATYPDGSLAAAMRYVVLGSPTVSLTGQTVEYGALVKVRGVVRHAPFACEFASFLREQLYSSVRFRAGTIELPDARMEVEAYQCIGNALTFPIAASLADLPFGSYEITADIPAGVLAAASSAPVQVVVAPSRTLQAATGRGRIQVGSRDPGYPGQTGKCVVRYSEAVLLSATGAAAPGPNAVELPYGALRIELGECLFVSNSDFIPPPLPPAAQVVLLELDEEPAPGTVAWAYGPTAQQPQPHWYELRTSIAARFVQFEVEDGGIGDQLTGRDQAISSLVTLGVPRHASIAGSFQDLWWAGPEENGWGMSITQHRDVLFGALFVYDANGDPRWFVMPGGAWNAERTSYSGSLYSPRGSQEHANLPSTFVPGAPVGTARLTPVSRDAMTLDYTIGGISGSKQITRQLFGPPHPFPTLRFDDLWWAGMTQNGWGFALAQQYRNYFGVIFTYDSQGVPIWYVAPSLTKTLDREIVGPMYRTRGSAWVGAPYNPEALVVTETGDIRLYFENAEQGSLSARIGGRPNIEALINRQPF